MSSRWMARVVDHPYFAILLCVLVVAVSGLGIVKFDVNHDPRGFFGEGNPDLELFRDFEAKYGDRDLVLFAIHPRNGTVFTQRNLHVLEQLTERGWEMPHAIRSQSLTNFQHTDVQGDDLYSEFLIEDALNLTDEQVSKIRAIALNEPALVHGAVSTSGHVGAVAVTVSLDEGRREAPVVAEWATRLQSEFSAEYPDVEFLLTGTVIFNEAMAKATQDGLSTMLPLSMLAGLVSLLILLRSISGTVFTLVVVVFSVFSALGVSAAAGIVFQPLSSYAPAIILTLGIADCLHILVSLHQGMRTGLSRRDAMLESLRINVQPVVLTSVTTAIGFVCLNTSESPPLQDLGNIVAVGVIYALFLSLVLLPALVMVFPIRTMRQEDARSQRWMAIFAEFVVRRRYVLLVSSSVLMVGLSACLPLNQFNDVWHKYFDDSYPVRHANDFVTTELTGLHRIDFSIPASNQGGISDPGYLAVLDSFKEWAESRPEVVYTVTYVDVIKRLNRDMHGADEAYYKVPESRELASQYLLLYEMTLPFGLGMDNLVTMDKDETLFSIVLKPSNSSAVMAFAESARQWLQDNSPSYMHASPTGLDLLFGSVARRNVTSMLSGTLMALLLISALIVFALKSVRYGLLSLLPNVLPAAMAFGVWGLISGEVGLSVSIVACLTLGIVVDDTIHFLSKYVRAKRENQLPTREAVLYSFKTVGVALVSTSIILTANFGVLAFSSFYPSKSLGMLTSITILLALIVDFLFFAPLLLVIDEWMQRRKQNGLQQSQSMTLDLSVASETIGTNSVLSPSKIPQPEPLP